MKIEYLSVLQNFLDSYYKGDSYKLEHDTEHSTFYLYILPNWNFVSKLFYIKIKVFSSQPININFLENEKLVAYIENSKTIQNPFFWHSFENKHYLISFSDSLYYETSESKKERKEKKKFLKKR